MWVCSVLKYKKKKEITHQSSLENLAYWIWTLNLMCYCIIICNSQSGCNMQITGLCSEILYWARWQCDTTEFVIKSLSSRVCALIIPRYWLRNVTDWTLNCFFFLNPPFSLWKTFIFIKTKYKSLNLWWCPCCCVFNKMIYPKDFWKFHATSPTANHTVSVS